MTALEAIDYIINKLGFNTLLTYWPDVLAMLLMIRGELIDNERKIQSEAAKKSE